MMTSHSLSAPSPSFPNSPCPLFPNPPMLQAGIFWEDIVNFMTGISFIDIIALHLSSLEVLPIQYGHQHSADF